MLIPWLKLAQILVDHQRRPQYALRVLEGLRNGTLNDKLKALQAQLDRKAQKMVDDGVIELQGRAW